MKRFRTQPLAHFRLPVSDQKIVEAGEAALKRSADLLDRMDALLEDKSDWPSLGANRSLKA
jgi:hypothetical protein